MKAFLYVALMHYPVYKKNGKVITTSITPLDIHDIARSCLTFGVRRYYVVNHLPTMQHLARRITGFWSSDYGANYNRTRTDAMAIVRIKEHLEDCIKEIEEEHAQKPRLVATSARTGPNRVGFRDLSDRFKKDEAPYLILLGTGWGLIDEFINRCDLLLDPIYGSGGYNHLSVRSAAAIILDRLCGN
ncbi:MAG: RNA methyltransferase [Candidatus Hinthialibacter sp.]